MPNPPNIVTLHQRRDGALILESGYDTTPVRYRLVEEPDEARLNDEAVSLGDYEALKARGLGHLHANAPYLVCTECRRHTWVLTSLGYRCEMTQPDGSACDGFFANPGIVRPVEAHNDEHDLNHLEDTAGA